MSIVCPMPLIKDNLGMSVGVKVILTLLVLAAGSAFIVLLRGQVSSGSGMASAGVLIAALLVIGGIRMIWKRKKTS